MDRKTAHISSAALSEKQTLEFLNIRPIPKLMKIPKLTQSKIRNSLEIPFGSLTMSPLKAYDVPDDVISLEEYGIGEMEFEKIVEKMRLDEESYITACTALIHMEEAAESKRINILGVAKVKFTLDSRLQSIFSTPFHVIITDQ